MTYIIHIFYLIKHLCWLAFDYENGEYSDNRGARILEGDQWEIQGLCETNKVETCQT